MKSGFLLTARVDLKGPTGTIWKRVVFSRKNLYILVNKKNDISNKKDFGLADWPFFCPPGGQETIIHLRMALVQLPCCVGTGPQPLHFTLHATFNTTTKTVSPLHRKNMEDRNK